MGNPVKKPASYADIARLPPGIRGEIVDGELFTQARPAPLHAQAASVLGMDVGGAFHRGRGGPGGWWILNEPEIHLGDDVLVPDLAGWRRERLPELPREAYFSLTPDWTCEVLSPSTRRFDRIRKLSAYCRHGVAYAWIVDPDVRTLEVFRREGEAWLTIAAHAEDEVVRAEPFAELELRLGDLWAGSED